MNAGITSCLPISFLPILQLIVKQGNVPLETLLTVQSETIQFCPSAKNAFILSLKTLKDASSMVDMTTGEDKVSLIAETYAAFVLV